MDPRKGFLDLPNELLILIGDSFDPDNLLGNACYYELCTCTRAYYDDTPDTAWQYMVCSSGLGRKDASMCWKDMVLECARHAWTCEYEGCGREHIERNRAHLIRLLFTPGR